MTELILSISEDGQPRADGVTGVWHYEAFDQKRRKAECIPADADDLKEIEQFEHTLKIPARSPVWMHSHEPNRSFRFRLLCPERTLH